MSEDNKVVPVVQAFLDAFNRRDVEAFVAQLSDDAVHEDSHGPTMRGKAEIYERYKAVFERDTQQHSLLMSRMALGPYVVDHEYVTGRPVGPFNVLAVYTVENGKIVHMQLLRHLGENS